MTLMDAIFAVASVLWLLATAGLFLSILWSFGAWAWRTIAEHVQRSEFRVQRGGRGEKV
jgi:high-affinity Fe2+/Pb2+ permease